ncbi:hypothetical protein DH2020_027248 [Rehmannia glutinosa]|uniref:QWRF motif-containing protein n=1 Tax=Rehmannia glutinosa TaxID=99300 RepID=A0ABR0VUN6_REHGL
MVTAVASTPKQRPLQNQKRPPLLPSDSDNAPPRRPKAREVTSRYLSLSTSSSSSNSSSSTNTTLSSITSGSSISSRRSPSPMLSGRAAITTPKSLQRAVSAERRRPAAATTPSGAEKMLVKSVRSLSVSFQGESYSLPVSKVKPPPAAAGNPGGLRKGTPERRKAGATPVSDRSERDRENSRPSDQQQHRWPGRFRGENSSFLTRSLDYGAERAKWNGSGSALKDLRKSMANENSRSKVVTELKLENNDEEARGVGDLESRQRLRDSLNSDVESISSESTVSGNAIQLKGGPRGVVVPARIWQDASNRVHKVPDPASPLSSNASNRTLVRGGARAASPCKALSSSTGALLRGIASPSRARSSTWNSMNANNTCGTPSMSSFAIDVRRGKLGENRIADAHGLRLLYNRILQWRLANAKVENTMLVQKQTAEETTELMLDYRNIINFNVPSYTSTGYTFDFFSLAFNLISTLFFSLHQRSLYNAWVTTSKLRHSVMSKGIELQLLRHNLKLYSILKGQEPHLDSWALFDRDHCNSVTGAIKALEASTVRLPIVCGAKGDVHKVQEAITSAVDVMQAMASSVCSLLVKSVSFPDLLLIAVGHFASTGGADELTGGGTF